MFPGAGSREVGMLEIPGWALGTALIIAVYAVARIAVLRIATQREHAKLDAPSDAALERVTQALEQVQQRLAELEERVDFTERVLAGQKEKARLPK
jgi:hypothetical protein